MKWLCRCLPMALMVLLLLPLAPWAVEPGKAQPQGRSRSWDTAYPRGVIDDDRFPPSGRYRPYRHRVHPNWCFQPHLPFFLFPPCCEPERRWYEEALPIPAGRLQLWVDPVQAQAFIGGYALERHSDLSYEVGLLEGEHQVEVTAEGFEPYRRIVVIRGGERVRLTIRLERAPRP